jgi:hypothetical protein
MSLVSELWPLFQCIVWQNGMAVDPKIPSKFKTFWTFEFSNRLMNRGLTLGITCGLKGMILAIISILVVVPWNMGSSSKCRYRNPLLPHLDFLWTLGPQMSCTQTIFKCKTFHVGSLKYLSSISFGFFHPDNVEDPLSDNSRISSIITVCTIVTGCVLLRHAGNCNRGDKCGFKHNLTYL